MALTCNPEIELPQLPLFPGKRQHWSLATKLGTSPEAVKQLFQRWLPLFPGPISEPLVLGQDDLPGAVGRLPPVAGVEPPQGLEVRGTADLVSVRFDYLGTANSMRWPTFVNRRRDRIDPLCPLREVDATPVAIGQGGVLLRAPQLEPLPPFGEDPLDLGVGPIRPPTLEQLSNALLGLGLVAAAGVGAYVFFKLRRD